MAPIHPGFLTRSGTVHCRIMACREATEITDIPQGDLGQSAPGQRGHGVNRK
jgi:hypothetical protein